jgi:nitroreductase
MKCQNVKRRNFFKRSVAAISSLILLPGVSQNLRAESNSDKSSIEGNETLKTINKLRTIHGNFTDQEISEKHLQQILQATIRAANSSNMQTYSIVVIKDKQKMKDVCGYQGSRLLLYCVDYTRIKASADLLNHPYHPDSITHFITGSTNTILAAQTAAIAARSLGIDYLLTNGIHRGDMERVWKILNLPKTHCFPLIAMVLGYPDKEPAFKKGRLDGLGIVHYDNYHTPSEKELNQITEKYDDKEEHIALISDWDEQGHTHYQDWLYKVWLKRNAKPTANETQMYGLLKRSRFVDLQL